MKIIHNPKTTALKFGAQFSNRNYKKYKDKPKYQIPMSCKSLFIVSMAKSNNPNAKMADTLSGNATYDWKNEMSIGLKYHEAYDLAVYLGMNPLSMNRELIYIPIQKDANGNITEPQPIYTRLGLFLKYDGKTGDKAMFYHHGQTTTFTLNPEGGKCNSMYINIKHGEKKLSHFLKNDKCCYSFDEFYHDLINYLKMSSLMCSQIDMIATTTWHFVNGYCGSQQPQSNYNQPPQPSFNNEMPF